jgi:ethanolamine phosphate transferase 2 subunit G
MSGTASNYDLPRMFAGITLSCLSLLLICGHMFQQPVLYNVDTLLFGIIVASYGGMMFASSYVEEEQHFWYWISAGWIFYIRCRR